MWQFDMEMEVRSSEAAGAGKKLVYVGLVDVAAGTCSVSLQVTRTSLNTISGVVLHHQWLKMINFM